MGVMAGGGRPLAVAVSSSAWVDHVSVADTVRRALTSRKTAAIITTYMYTSQTHLSASWKQE